MMALADIEKPEILPGENILAVKELSRSDGGI